MAADYLNVKTGQDLVELGIKPKSSSRQMALIAYDRLIALRDHITAQIEDDMLGGWTPLVEASRNDDASGKPSTLALAEGVVANRQLGHRVRLRRTYEGAGPGIPAGTRGTLWACDDSKGMLTIGFELADDTQQKVTLGLEAARQHVDVSTLGQLLPLDKQQEVKANVLAEFFPSTVLDAKRVERIIIALLMGKDLILYGPPGSGKSNVAKDIVAIAQRGQPVIFVEQDCQVQCNPFSIFDAEFAKDLDACPECKVRYDREFKTTGRFRRPPAAQVRVKPAAFGEGQGIEYVEGTVGLQRMHLTGHKIPRLDGATEGVSDFDPEGFHAGILPRTNNGVLHLDEMEKLRPQTRDCLLDALNSERIKPDQLRYTYPAHALIVGTTNDHTKFSGAINDRMAMLAVRYPEDAETSYSITRRGYHGEGGLDTLVQNADPHLEEGFWLRRVPMPVIFERTVDALYMKFRASYQRKSPQAITASNRSKFDALDAARAKLMVDRLFDTAVPHVVDRERTIYGIKYAFCIRVQGMATSHDRKSKVELVDWVDKFFDETLRGEEDVWWCRAYKHIATAAAQVPEIGERFRAELSSYEQNIEAAWPNFLAVRQARHDSGGEQIARLDYPLVDYLFVEQPHFDSLAQNELVDLLELLLDGRERTTCTPRL